MFFANVKEIDARDLSEWISDEGRTFRIIDVREPMEIAQGSIPGAEAMPMSSLGSRLSEFDQQEEVVFICRSGARSGQVVAYLAQNGFENVYNLRGGVIGWAQNGLEFAKVS
ncbi:MAG: rhodanese-like domain-containing protein [Gammaproteobacteria bacterium]|nr:rhodanese-like domain-containing protein [Gammaproteobacteria bacterium]MCW8972948.1 rhodanese-like domain-containing protein [Gammaproteobacteria bacterium]MCW8992895.1 rhodanese-like domain-containing protein [Gammaproteobacteria bacterium]